MLIFEKSQLPSLRKVNAKELKETVQILATKNEKWATKPSQVP